MTNRVIKFPGLTTVEEPPEQVLEKAKQWGCDQVMIIGLKGNELMFGGSFSEIDRMIYLLRATEHWILDDEREGGGLS